MDPSDTMSILSWFDVVVLEDETNEGGSDMRLRSDVSSRTYGLPPSLREVVSWKNRKRLPDAMFVLMSRMGKLMAWMNFMMARIMSSLPPSTDYCIREFSRHEK